MRDPLVAAFLQRALIATAVLGVAAGAVGVHVRLRRLAFVTDALAHTVFPGIALALAWGRSPSLGAMTAALASLGLVVVLGRQRSVGDDAALAVLLVTFLAVGVAVVSRSHSYAADLDALLFGRLLTVDGADVVRNCLAAAGSLTLVAALHKELVLRAFDPETAAALGYRLGALDLALDLAIALVVVSAFEAVGGLLVVALVVTPAAAAHLCTTSVRSAMAASITIAVAGGWVGLAASAASAGVGRGLPPGPSIVVVVSLAFGAVLVTTRARRFPGT